jgi:uncharacterized protein DUF488
MFPAPFALAIPLYPCYSSHATHTLAPKEGGHMATVDSTQPIDSIDTDPGELWSIGHSNHSIERFLALLRQHEIATLADVRTAPYSRYSPQFNRDELALSIRTWRRHTESQFVRKMMV